MLVIQDFTKLSEASVSLRGRVTAVRSAAATASKEGGLALPSSRLHVQASVSSATACHRAGGLLLPREYSLDRITLAEEH